MKRRRGRGTSWKAGKGRGKERGKGERKEEGGGKSLTVPSLNSSHIKT